MADMLSRSSPVTEDDTTGTTDNVEVHAVFALDYMVTDATPQKLVNETAPDDYLRTVFSCLSTGENIERELKPF